jgi:hypothetical protein
MSSTPQNGEPSRIIGAISKFAGTLVGSVVSAGNRIIGSGSAPVVAKPKAPVKGQKKAAGKPVSEGPKKKEKVVKRKGTGSSGKSETFKKEPAQSPTKKKKAPKKTKKTAKNELSNHAQGSLISETGAEMNVPIEKQEPQAQLPIAEAEIADEKSSDVNGPPEESTEKKDTTESQKPSIPIIEYNDKANKAVVPTTSML